MPPLSSGWLLCEMKISFHSPFCRTSTQVDSAALLLETVSAQDRRALASRQRIKKRTRLQRQRGKRTRALVSSAAHQEPDACSICLADSSPRQQRQTSMFAARVSACFLQHLTSRPRSASSPSQQHVGFREEFRRSAFPLLGYL